MTSSSKEKAHWTQEYIHIFCELCIQQIDKGHRPGTHFSKDGWKTIVSKFEELTGKRYDKCQLKNKWDNLKEEWKKWKQLIKGETGLGWDPRKKTVDASDEWWEKKIQINPKFSTFRKNGITPELEALLDRMFMNAVATGDVTWCPSQGLTSNKTNEEVTSLDTDDELSPTAPKDIVEDITKESPNKVRKRAFLNKTGSLRVNKERKLGGYAKLSKQLDVICSAIERKNAVSQEKEATEKPYVEIMDKLEGIPDIVEDEKLHFFALRHLKEQMNQTIFRNLKGDDKRVNWLKHEMHVKNN